MKFRLVQIGRLQKTNGWNLMYGKTFIRSFGWNRKDQADYFVEKLNETLNHLDNSCFLSKQLIQKGRWIKPPKDSYLG